MTLTPYLRHTYGPKYCTESYNDGTLPPPLPKEPEGRFLQLASLLAYDLKFRVYHLKHGFYRLEIGFYPLSPFSPEKVVV